MADTGGLNPPLRKEVWVRIPPRARITSTHCGARPGLGQVVASPGCTPRFRPSGRPTRSGAVRPGRNDARSERLPRFCWRESDMPRWFRSCRTKPRVAVARSCVGTSLSRQQNQSSWLGVPMVGPLENRRSERCSRTCERPVGIRAPIAARLDGRGRWVLLPKRSSSRSPHRLWGACSWNHLKRSGLPMC